ARPSPGRAERPEWWESAGRYGRSPETSPGTGRKRSGSRQRRRRAETPSPKPSTLSCTMARSNHLREVLLASVESIHVPGMDHNAPIPAGARVGNIVMSSPISGRELNTNRLPDDPDEQAAVMFDNIRAFLKAAGCGPENMLKLTLFFKDIKY